MYQLKNAELVASFNDNGGIIGLFDRRTAREYITCRGLENACRVMLPDGQWDGRFADTSGQKECVVRQKDNKITFHFPGLVTEDEKSTKVSLELNYSLWEDEIYADYEIENKDKSEFVSHVMFPMVTGIGREYKDNRLVMPEQSPFGDTRVEDPYSYGDGNHKDWTRNCNRKSVRYPQLLATSWMDYSDSTGGISLEQRSEAFDICDMGFERIIMKDKGEREKNIECLQFSLQSYPSVNPGEKRTSPGYVIGLHKGDWKTPAMRHRKWLKQRVLLPEIPKAFKQALGWHFFFMKQQDETVYYQYRDLPAMASAIQKAGFNHMMVFGWYPCGHDNEYPYGYYANEAWGGKAALKKQLQLCREKGCSVIPFFNGTLMDISTRGYREGGFRWPVLGRTKKPYCGTEFSRANNDMGFSNACIHTTTRNMTLLDVCITAREVKTWWLETITRIVQEYGFQNLQLDQIAHKSYICYDENHHHERPEYAYTKELKELLSKVREIVRGENGSGLMIGEGMSDLTMQYCDGFWNWHQALNKPEIIRYSIPWMSYSHEVDANEYDMVNLCFAERILLDLKIEGGDGIVTDYPEFSAHLKKLAQLKKRLGPAYTDGEYFLQDDLKIMEEDNVLIRLYKEEDRVAIVMANLTKQQRCAQFSIGYPLRNITVSDFNGRKEWQPNGPYTFRLGTYEVMVLEGIKEE